MSGNEEIHGTVHFPPDDRSTVRATVKLQGLSSIELRGVTDQDGNFTFTHLRPDTYSLVIDAGDAYEKARETVSIGFSGSVPAQGNVHSYATPAVYQLEIYLKPRNSHGVAAAAGISDAAKKLFDKALEERRSGNHAEAIEQLKKAIAQAPRFTGAYRELGVEYLKTGDGRSAIETFEHALKIEPNDAALRLNYGIALMNQKKLDAAEAELRSAVTGGKEYSTPARYYLGVTLVAEQKFDDAREEFEEVVKNAGDRFPLAHRYLGGIYLRNKEYGRAANELEKYLELDPKAADAQKIRETIKKSRSKN